MGVMGLMGLRGLMGLMGLMGFLEWENAGVEKKLLTMVNNVQKKCSNFAAWKQIRETLQDEKKE